METRAVFVPGKKAQKQQRPEEEEAGSGVAPQLKGLTYESFKAKVKDRFYQYLPAELAEELLSELPM